MLPVQNRLVLLKKKVIANVFMVASMYFWYQNKFPLSTQYKKKRELIPLMVWEQWAQKIRVLKSPCIFNDIVLFKQWLVLPDLVGNYPA